MSETLFISDLHLSDATPDIEHAFYALLEREVNASALYILGDFFEAWVGDDDDSALAHRVRSALKRYTKAGAALFLMRGNRDFMLGPAFAEDVGGQLLADTALLELAGEPTLLMHGDTLCTDDTDYQQFRALVHDTTWQQQMLATSLDERRAMAQQLRAMSADAASNKPEDIMDVNADAVLNAMQQVGAKRLIHGHTHRPARHPLAENRERIVLGDWNSTGWCLRCSGHSLSLEEFPVASSLAHRG